MYRRTNTFFVLLLLVLCVVGFGFYSGWWSVSSSSPDEGSEVDINLKVNPDKIKADANKVKEKTEELTGQADNDADEDADNDTDEDADNDADESDDQAKDKVAPEDQ